jgi:hypothetical protein
MTSRYLALKLSLWGQKTFMHFEGKILRKNFKGLFGTFSLKIQKFVKEFFGFFPLNFQFFPCFCKGILGTFPLKNEKFTPSILACKMSRGLNKKPLKVILTSNRMRILRAPQTPQRLRKNRFKFLEP